MFKREMQRNCKSFIIWTSVLILLYLIVFLIYPAIIDGGNIAMINDMMKIFPEEILKAFNMDISSLDSVFGWIKSEGFVFELLLISIYSAILGSNILLKEEDDKTIEYLNSLPIKRNSIVLNKVLSGIIYISLMVIIIGIFNYFGLTLSGPFDQKTYLLLSITPLLTSLPFFFICLYLSTFTHKTKKTIGISLGIVFMSYFINTIAQLSTTIEYLKYISIFTLADIRNIITTSSINIIMILVSLMISGIFMILSIINYNKKELV